MTYFERISWLTGKEAPHCLQSIQEVILVHSAMSCSLILLWLGPLAFFSLPEYGMCSGPWPPPKCCFPLSSQLPALSVQSGLCSALPSNRPSLIFPLWCWVTVAFTFLSLIYLLLTTWKFVLMLFILSLSFAFLVSPHKMWSPWVQGFVMTLFEAQSGT